jgi:peroxiredoxin
MRTSFLYCVLIIVVISACNSVREKPVEENSAIVVEMNDRPYLMLNLTNGNKVNVHELEEKSVIVLFQPDCDHCQHEAEDIEKNIRAFEGYQIFFVSSHPMEIIEKFAVDYKLSAHPSVHFAQASVDDILKKFGPVQTPSIYVYTKGGTLKKSFNGQTDVQSIINVL